MNTKIYYHCMECGDEYNYNELGETESKDKYLDKWCPNCGGISFSIYEEM